eukprot:scaffold65823_cov40-Cyclotella_meneghiniana.AAC.4
MMVQSQNWGGGDGRGAMSVGGNWHSLGIQMINARGARWVPPHLRKGLHLPVIKNLPAEGCRHSNKEGTSSQKYL